MKNKILKAIVSDSDLGKDLCLLTLRLVFGLTMLFAHGIPKIISFSERSGSFPDPLGVTPTVSLVMVILSEVVAALGVAFGVFTRIAAVPLIVTMCVAAFVVLGAEPFAKKELALVFLGGYVAIFLGGAGRFSVDRLF
jgi:putative oxidoreductase